MENENLELINFQGINCFYYSLATLLNDLNLDYTLLFSNLWSETDFDFDDESQLFVSK